MSEETRIRIHPSIPEDTRVLDCGFVGLTTRKSTGMLETANPQFHSRMEEVYMAR